MLGDLLWGGLQVLAGVLLFVALHELGHVLVARWLGDREASFVVIGRRRGEWVLATTFTRLNTTDTWGGVAVALAGVTLTRLLAEPLGLLLTAQALPLRPLWLTVFVLCRTDLWLYAVRNFVSGELLRQPQPGADLSDAVRGAAGLLGVRQTPLFVAVLLAACLDLWWGWPLLRHLLFGV